jgi:hypothetical protein
VAVPRFCCRAWRLLLLGDYVVDARFCCVRSLPLGQKTDTSIKADKLIARIGGVVIIIGGGSEKLQNEVLLYEAVGFCL